MVFVFATYFHCNAYKNSLFRLNCVVCLSILSIVSDNLINKHIIAIPFYPRYKKCYGFFFRSPIYKWFSCYEFFLVQFFFLSMMEKNSSGNCNAWTAMHCYCVEFHGMEHIWSRNNKQFEAFKWTKVCMRVKEPLSVH